MKKINSYLTDIISGSFSARSENRLTKIFCSSFNHSAMFQDLFLDFIGHKTGLNLIAFDQLYEQTGRRNFLDIVISTKDRNDNPLKPVVVIENKIKAPLTKKQLRSYDKIQGIKYVPVKNRIALVKNYFDKESYDWRIKHWSEFYYHIVNSRLLGKLPKYQIDKFIINNFLKYLENYNMSTVKSINLSELGSIYYLFSVSEKLKRFGFTKSVKRMQPFEMVSKYINMLEDLVVRAKSSKIICKRAKNFQFNPRITYIEFEGERFPYLATYISLKPNERYTRLYTGVYYSKKKCFVYTTIQNRQREFDFEMKYNKRELDFDYYCKETIKYWEKKLRRN